MTFCYCCALMCAQRMCAGQVRGDDLSVVISACLIVIMCGPVLICKLAASVTHTHSSPVPTRLFTENNIVNAIRDVPLDMFQHHLQSKHSPRISLWNTSKAVKVCVHFGPESVCGYRIAPDQKQCRHTHTRIRIKVCTIWITLVVAVGRPLLKFRTRACCRVKVAKLFAPI
jgi:hypothetical protein